MRRFAAPTLPLAEGEQVQLDADVAHHVHTVNRLGPGDVLVLFDGEGRQARATLVDAAGRCRLEEAPHEVRPSHALHLLVGVPKGPAMDLAVRMATEAGATHIHPVRTRRSVPKGERHDRWQRIATSAAQQCGRADVPEILPVATLDEALRAVASVPDRRVALPGAARTPPASGDAVVLIGPEGGLTEAEVATARAAGFEPLGLGDWVLRTSTAAAVAVALVTPD